jgi:hypothetical protein
MRGSKFILLLTIILVLGAGVVVGRLWAKLPLVPTPPDKHPSWVAKELDLTAEQQQQMDAIWSETRQKMGNTFEQRRSLDRQRDQEVADLLSTDPKMKAAYDKIMTDARQQRSDLDKVREKLVKDAEERSRALLSEDQKKRWDAMPRGPRDHGPRGGGPNSTNPSTRPSRPMRDRSFEGH